MNNAVICFDIDRNCVYANEKALEIFNRSSDRSVFTAYMNSWITEKDMSNVDSFVWSERKTIGHKTYYFDIEYRKLFGKKKECIGFFLNLVDNTKKYLAFEEERYLATHDKLTGLYNKEYFGKKIIEAMKANPEETWMLLGSNIKDFKLINDLFGLEKGNEVLKMEADLLKERCGENVIYGRTDGDKLEITETAFMTGTAGEFERIDQFRKYGFQVEIDDFGSGYSSFNTLKDMDVDVLKIDMGFLRTTKPEHIEKSMSILNSIISLCKTLGLSVITEGVETREQLERLTKMGCEIYQGYYFSKPVAVKQFEETYFM